MSTKQLLYVISGGKVRWITMLRGRSAMAEELFRIRFRFPGGEEFEAEGNREFIEQQRNYFLALIGKKQNKVNIFQEQISSPAAKRPTYPLTQPQTEVPNSVSPRGAVSPGVPTDGSAEPFRESFSILPAAQRYAQKPLPPNTPAEFPALRLWERILKEEGEIVLLRKKMRLTAQEAALLLLAGARVLLKKPAFSALDLSRSMKKSGFTEGRLDRLLQQDIKSGHITSEGSKRSRSYRLTNQGFAKAYVLAEKLGGEIN